MAFYSYMFSANYKKFNEKLKIIAIDNNKSFPLLLIDTYYCVVRYGTGLTDYLNYKFYTKNSKERTEYAGIKIQNKFYETVSPEVHKKRYTVKPTFLKEFSEYVKRDFIVPEEVELTEFKRFLKKHDVFMIKPYDGLGGHGVHKINTKDIANIEEYYQECCENKLFLEEVVKQHKEMDKLCATSCNTIRIMTYNNNGNPEILWAGLRIGNGVNSVDNFHAGGMASEIDLDSGSLLSNPIDKDLNTYKVHPVSKVKLKGYIIPEFDKVKELVKKASLESDKILLVGWDVAISVDGPLIIEGNRRPGFDIVQVCSDRGRKDIIRYVFDEYKKENLHQKK